jgi:CDP-diacylglycerol---glycerol-3-phosphate 3-phosphatidyltransferase
MSAPRAVTPPVLNIANALTCLRLVLVPVFLVVLFVDHGQSVQWRLVAFGVFAVAAVTDRLDGELARRRGLVTAFGTVADPIADKALTGAAWVALSVLGEVPWWATVVMLGREIGITLLRFAVLRRGIIPASRGGKAKTLVQSLAIGVYLLPLPELVGATTAVEWVRGGLLAAALALTVVTGVDYVRRALRLRAVTAPHPPVSAEDTRPDVPRSP